MYDFKLFQTAEGRVWDASKAPEEDRDSQEVGRVSGGSQGCSQPGGCRSSPRRWGRQWPASRREGAGGRKGEHGAWRRGSNGAGGVGKESGGTEGEGGEEREGCAEGAGRAGEGGNEASGRAGEGAEEGAVRAGGAGQGQPKQGERREEGEKW